MTKVRCQDTELDTFATRSCSTKAVRGKRNKVLNNRGDKTHLGKPKVSCRYTCKTFSVTKMKLCNLQVTICYMVAISVWLLSKIVSDVYKVFSLKSKKHTKTEVDFLQFKFAITINYYLKQLQENTII